MAKRKTASPAVKDKILATASRLFRFQGYSETGINQIIDEAGVARASLYLHFPTKEALGQAYLQSYGATQFELLEHLMRRYPDPTRFVTAWARILKREARDVGLNGCAIANLHAQTPTEHTDLQNEIRATAQRTIDTLAEYLKRCQQAGSFPKKRNLKQTARQLFLTYEGVMQAWQLTGDMDVIDDLARIGQRLVED